MFPGTVTVPPKVETPDALIEIFVPTVKVPSVSKAPGPSCESHPVIFVLPKKLAEPLFLIVMFPFIVTLPLEDILPRFRV